MTDIENSQEPSQALLPEGAAEAAAEQLLKLRKMRRISPVSQNSNGMWCKLIPAWKCG